MQKNVTVGMQCTASPHGFKNDGYGRAPQKRGFGMVWSALLRKILRRCGCSVPGCSVAGCSDAEVVIIIDMSMPRD